MALKALEPLEQFATDVILDRAAGRRAALLKPILLRLATVYAGIMRLYADLLERRGKDQAAADLRDKADQIGR